jgi:predicted type IV restriction endonuclease
VGAPDAVVELVERFRHNFTTYLNPAYNETQVRIEFIDPFFKALGWDVDNSAGNAPQYRDVVHEDAIKVGIDSRAPDYSFRVGGARKFFVEAKKPAVNLKDDPSPAYQLRRYAWSAKLPLSILTDFQEFVVYDCRVRPANTDKAPVARIMYATFDEYEHRWDEIASIFSKDAIYKGSFDQYAESTKAKKGTAEVDTAFLKEIETWRDELARNIALRNRSLSTRELNYAVQATIDRIIFLRICEDRLIEPYGRLQGLVNGQNVWERLRILFFEADHRYNSGLFHFEQEKGRADAPDTLTPELVIDDRVLKEILKRLYYPESPYEFSVLPADILGQVYEQFLGKVIRLTTGHQAKVEDKPEVKKAGGVYYTPTYIVDYIVKNTVGRLLEGLAPKQAADLRILDPACGSGSFLIGAYQCLLDWHRDWYVEHALDKKNKPLVQGRAGEWQLTTAEKKRILLNNIYGVDIDSQAVETTKLSLLLKVLEGETSETIDAQLSFLHERALPDLAANIKCGNSLIGPDFYDDQQLGLTGLDDEERYRINVFDWEAEFPQILGKAVPEERRGFDGVIGNPPYIPIESMSSLEKAYYTSHHAQLERKYDSSAVFILKGLSLLRQEGLLAYISSVSWQTGENYARLREHVFRYFGVLYLVNLPFDVFKGAYVDTGVYVLGRIASPAYRLCRFPKKERHPRLDSLTYVEVPATLVKAPGYKIVLNPSASTILERAVATERFITLGELTMSTQGLSANRFQLAPAPQTDGDWHAFLAKGQVYRWALRKEDVLFADMQPHANLLPFYRAVPKLLVRRVINRQDRLMVTFCNEELVFKKDINPFVLTSDAVDPLAILAVMNSRLVSWLYVNTSSIATKDDFRQTTLAELRRLPIPAFDVGHSSASRLVTWARRLLDLNSDSNSLGSPHESDMRKREAASIESQIDRLIYDLYGLTDDEIAVVESSVEKA